MKIIIYVALCLSVTKIILAQTSNPNPNNMITPNFSQTPKNQGQGEIIINAPVSVVWQLIKMDQKKNRIKAMQSLKSYVENGTAIKN